jgi:hypothetical protein
LRRIAAHPTLLAECQPGWRRVLLARFPYLVAYVVDDETIYVVGLFHTRRDPAPLNDTMTCEFLDVRYFDFGQSSHRSARLRRTSASGTVAAPAKPARFRYGIAVGEGRDFGDKITL